MVKSDLKKVLLQFENAIERFAEVLKKDANIENAFIDASIQRFEFCFELCWKLIQRSLEIEGITVRSPREAFAEALRQDWLPQGDTFWMDMIESRNLSAHTYKEEMAARIYSLLPGYLEAFENLAGCLKTRYL